MDVMTLYEDSIKYLLVRPLEYIVPMLGGFINAESEEDGLTVFERVLIDTPEPPWMPTVIERDQTVLCIIHMHETYGYFQKNLENILFVCVQRDYLLCYAHLLLSYEFPDHIYQMALDIAPSLSVENIVRYYQHKVKTTRRRRFMGMFRCFPMLMLWRKRVVERMYHPSNINFCVYNIINEPFTYTD